MQPDAAADAPPRSRRIVAIVFIAMVCLAGFSLLLGRFGSPCTGYGCVTYPHPVVAGATVTVSTFPPSPCQVAEGTVTCLVFLHGGDQGTVSVDVSIADQNSQQGSPQFEFLVYSSASNYVSFAAIPTCAHTSAPSYEDRGCVISGGSTGTFTFSFAVSQTYGDATARWPDSISVVMWMNCCFP